jgi:hypothetical protein
MTILLIVEKNGNIKETKVKNLQVSELYKKAGFKSEEGFLEPVVSWPRPGVDPFTLDYQIQVFGKTKGRAGQENKYDFPQPIDTTLFFGNVAMIAVRPDGGVVDLTMSAWEMVYEQLFGGFEDLVDSHGRPLDDSEEVSEEEELEGVEYTKDGYVKDDFVVDDDEDEYVEEEKPVFRKLLDSEEEDSEFEPSSKKSSKSVKKVDKKVDTKTEKKPVAKKSAKSVKKASIVVAEIEAPVIPEVAVDNFVKVEKKAKKSKKSKEVEPIVLEIPEPVAEPPTPEPTSEEEEPETKSKKARKARAVKEPKEAKVKKVKEPKEPKEKSETKKKPKRSGKKILDDTDSEMVYVPMDTIELEEEKYV